MKLLATCVVDWQVVDLWVVEEVVVMSSLHLSASNQQDLGPRISELYITKKLKQRKPCKEELQEDGKRGRGRFTEWLKLEGKKELRKGGKIKEEE